MQCVVLAAGKGARMLPLTEVIPKPLIKVCGKTILDHIVEALPPEIDELILVVGYKAEQIRDHCGEEFYGRPVKYVEQADYAKGTADALLYAKSAITGKFLMMYADDIHGAKTLHEAVKQEHCLLAAHSDTPQNFGVIELNEDGTLHGIIEKPEVPPSNLVNTGGGAVLDPTIFDYKAPQSKQGEYYITDSITDYAQDHKVKVLEQDLWLPVGYPENIAAAEAVLCPKTIDLEA